MCLWRCNLFYCLLCKILDVEEVLVVNYFASALKIDAFCFVFFFSHMSQVLTGAINLWTFVLLKPLLKIHSEEHMIQTLMMMMWRPLLSCAVLKWKLFVFRWIHCKRLACLIQFHSWWFCNCVQGLLVLFCWMYEKCRISWCIESHALSKTISFLNGLNGCAL